MSDYADSITFATIAALWRKCKSHLQQETLISRLFGPERGWFCACRAWVQGGPEPPASSEIAVILASVQLERRRIAEVHIHCAQVARNAHVFSASTVESQALAELEAMFADLPSPLQGGFFRDLVNDLLGRQQVEQDSVGSLFPLVRKNGDGKVIGGMLARFVLEPMQEGSGTMFLAPEQAFVPMDEDFRAVFLHAAQALKAAGFDTPRRDVRVRIHRCDLTSSSQNPLLYESLSGNSGGGALALGVWSAWTRTPMEAALVTSFALTPPRSPAAPAPQPDGNAYSIGSDLAKGKVIQGEIGPHGCFLVAEKQPKELNHWAEQLGLRLERAATVREAIDKTSGLIAELLAYLEALQAETNRVPVYYPSGARLEQVRVRVRVFAERQQFDVGRARERARRQGLPDDDSAARAYSHRHARDGEEEKQTEVRILDWDREVRHTLRRGVVVGDPGLGKTWLLKWQAAHIAAQAAERIREADDLCAIVLPIYRRLTDVAASLETLAERRKHGTTDTPSLAEAVVESLRGFQLPATQDTPARPLSDRMQQFIRERLGTDRCLLLLDALDEVPIAQRPALLAALRAWVEKNPQAHVLLTSRVVGYTQPWGVPLNSDAEREMEMLPFEDGQIAEFIEVFFAAYPDAAQEMRELLRHAPALRGMAQIPLLLGFLCALNCEMRQKPQSQRREFANARRNNIYAACLRRLLTGGWRDCPTLLTDEEVDAKLELLEQVAFRLFREEKEQFSMRELRRVTRGAYELLYGRRPSEDEEKARIQTWSEQDGLLIKAGAGESPPYLFLHLTFQEYLTACALAHEINEGSSRLLEDAWAFVDDKIWDTRWEDVIILLMGLLENPIRLLELLMDKSKDDKFRHRLCLAGRCLPELSFPRQQIL